MHSLVEVVSPKLQLEGEDMACERAGTVEALVSLVVWIGTITHSQLLGPLILAYKSFKFRDSSSKIFLDQTIIRVISLVICILIPDITRVTNILIQRVICPFLECWRVIRHML